MAPSSVQSSIQSGISSAPEVADEVELGEDTGIQRSLLGVLYTVNKEKSSSSIPWIAFRLVSDWLQLWLIMVNPLYGFHIKEKETAWQIFSFIQLNAFMSARGYTFFLVAMYLFVGLLMGSLAISVWIGWSFSNNRFNSLWPIVLLRSFSNFFFQALDVASMTLFLQALDCQYWNAPPGQQFHNQEFRGVQCFTMPHLIHAGVAGISLAVFIFMATLFTAGEMELNPVSKDAMAIPHSEVEVYGFLIKVLMTFASTFISSFRWLCIIQLTLSLIQLYLYIYWVPMLLDWVNHVRCASYASVTYAALIFVLIVYELGIDPDDTDAVHQHRVQLTNALYGGAVPAFLLGGAASWWRLRYFHRTVLTRITEAPPGSRPLTLYKFTDGRQLEVLLRSCRIWVEEDMLQTEAVSGAEAVLACAMAQLPKDPYVIILYSSFLIEVQSSYQTGYAQLQAAKKADPPFLMRFAIFSREQAHTQRSASTGASGPVDLVGYVELQRNYQLALKVHRDALLATRAFWTCLLHWNVSLRTIAKAIKRIDITVKAAERVYKAVMRRHVNNAQMLRMYAAFLETVKHDPWGASKWLAEADKLEEQEEHARNDDVFKLGDKSLQAVLGPAGAQEARGVVVTDAQGIVQLVNQSLLDMFGYAKMELKGKNISMLVPPPFGEHHNTFLRNYIATGTEVILNTTSQVIGMHKERCVMPIALTVTKISGIGEDTMFLGVITGMAVEPDTATIWATASGQVVSVDMTFSDWTGFRPEDVAGREVTSLVQQDAALAGVLASVRASPTFCVPGSKPSANMTVSAFGDAGVQDVVTFKEQLAVSRKAHTGDYSMLGTSNLQNQRGSAVTRLGATLSPYPSGTLNTTHGSETTKELRQISQPFLVQQAVFDLPEVAFFHKYCDPVNMEVLITAAGMGAFQLHVLKLRRLPGSDGKANHVVVSDSRGRVIHASNNLAVLLGTTSKQLQANGLTRAVEKLMAPPFAQLHRSLATSIPATAPPPYSCRKGLSILLAGNGPQGPYSMPFKITGMSRRTAQEEPVHVMELSQRTMAEAVAERCLELTCDMDGIVCKASDSPKKLFGFIPSSLVGQPLTAFIDIFKATLPSVSAAEDLLVELGKRAVRAPGTSINVAVAVPPRSVKHGPSARVMAQLSTDASTPAMMVVSMEGGPISEEPEDDDAPMLLKLQLWRSDLLTGVLQLDLDGKVMSTRTPMPMYPAGPIFGVSAESLVGAHIGRYLPLTSKSHMDMLKPRINEELTLARKRSSMKLDNPGRGDEAQDSMLHSMRILHMVDGQEMRLAVTAIKKVPTAATASGDASSVGSMYLLIRIAGSPPGGKAHGLLECLAAPVPSSEAVAMAVASSGKSKRGPTIFDSAKAIPHSDSASNMNPILSLPVMNLLLQPQLLGRGSSNVVDNSFTLHTPDVGSALPDPRAPPRSEPTLEQEASALMEGAELGSFGRAPAPSQPAPLAATPSATANAKAVRFGGGGAGSVAPSPAPLEVAKIDLDVPQDRIALWVASANTTRIDAFEEQNSSGLEPIKGIEDVRDDMSAVGGNSSDSGSGPEKGPSGMRADLSDTADPPDEAQAATTDYKRGSRSKKLMRLLSTDAVQSSKMRFRFYTRIVVLVLAVANIGGFVLMNQLLVAQSSNVEALNTAGIAARFANRISANTRILNILFSNQGVRAQPGTADEAPIAALAGLEGDEDIPSTLESISNFVTQFQIAHEKSYLYATSSLANEDLRSIWRDNLLNETTIAQIAGIQEQQVPANSSVPGIKVALGAAREDYVIVPSNMTLQTVRGYRNSSLFTLGELLVGKTKFLLQNAYAYNSSLNGPVNTTNWGDMASARWITTNSPNILTNTYLRVLDLMLTSVIDAANKVNQIQMVLLCVEGVALALLAMSYIVYLTIKVGDTRRHVFTIFLSLPAGMVRQLAAEPINLPDQDDPNGTGAIDVPLIGTLGAVGTAPAETPFKATSGAVGRSGMSASQMTFGAIDDALKQQEEDKPQSLSTRMLSVLRLWRPRSKVHPKDKDHKSRHAPLHNSFLSSLYMVWPLLIWAGLVVLINLVGHDHLAKIGAPISTFNIINFVSIRFQRNTFWMYEMASNPVDSLDASLRSTYVASTRTMAQEYNAMLYGGHTADDPRPHFTLTTDGISDQAMAADILYHNEGCVCVDPGDAKACVDPSNPQYGYVGHGVNIAMQRVFEVANTLNASTVVPKLWGAEFAFYWAARANIRCGLSELNLLYQANVTQSYRDVLTLHIILFALSWIVFAFYLLFILRPFVAETSAETRRVADLLSELPPEMDVEGLVQRMVIAKYVPPAVVEENSKAPPLRAMSLREGSTSRRPASGF